MPNLTAFFSRLYEGLLSERSRDRGEVIIVVIAIAGFLIHLGLIGLNSIGLVMPESFSELIGNPIFAIYTPFSFILLYEVYLLVYYLPKSVSKYIGKQYEIITLIVIRKIFNDISKLEFTSNWFQVQDDLQFTFDITASLALFFLIYVFYWLNQRRGSVAEITVLKKKDLDNFIRIKQGIALLLVPLFFGLVIFNFGQWLIISFVASTPEPADFANLNNIFFEDFFTILILTDVLLLLVSFLYTNQFHQVIRNSGFVISTVLIKISFGQQGLVSTVLTVVAVLIGVLVLAIHNRYEKLKY
jgi:hypothetical protein